MATIRVQAAGTPKLVINGPIQGPAGRDGAPGPGSAGVVVIQAEPAEIWEITHQLGYKPTVSVYDNDSEEIEAEVIHQSTTQLTVYLSTPLAGFVRLY